MIRDPRPYPSKASLDPWPTHFVITDDTLQPQDIHKIDTTPNIPAIPKMQQEQNYNNKAMLQEWAPQEIWTPPPYWRELLVVQETKWERICKAWFIKLFFMMLILYVIVIISIFLYKLLILVINTK